MEEDCSNFLDVYLNNEAQKLLLCSPWKEESSFFCENDNNMDAGDAERDIEALFNGEAHSEVENNVDDDDGDTSSESENENWSFQEASKEITDDKIKNLRVKELNDLLRNIPCDEAAKIRRRRRNLKNRDYALTCRLRKQREHEDLMNENTSLKKQLEDGKWKLLKVFNEKEAYKKKYLQAQQAFTTYKQRIGASEVSLCR